MRLKYTVVVLLIAVVFTTITPVTGQEEPLPVILAKATPSIALAVEPIRDLVQQTTLVEAARANDFATFDALYRETPNADFAMLHELWTFSMTDPVGAFYGEETYARLARAHPQYARYIEEYRIVDRNGNVFYPTSETRAFLLRQAVIGTPASAPRLQIAETGAPASPPADAAASRRRAPVVSTRAKAAARDAAASAGGDAGVPKVAAPRVVAAKVVVPKVVAEPVPVVVAEKTAAPAPPVVTKPEPATVAVDNSFASRGIFLLLIGIFGIGILAMMLRAPSELPKSIMEAPPADQPAPPPPPVEQLRRPASSGKNRAGGSHG